MDWPRAGPTRRGVLAATAILPVATVLRPATAAPAALDPRKLGFVPNAKAIARARALLARVGAADLHAHPGRIFSRLTEAPDQAQVGDRVVEDMRAGFVTMASFAAVADTSVLASTPTGIVATRDFRPGEAYGDYQRQIANLEAVAKARGIVLLRSPRDLKALVPGRDVGGFLTVEGGHFLEEDLAHVEGAFNDGVRCIVLTHYKPNGLGDNQTSPPTRGGLTPFGAAVVKEMNRLGMIVDVAHSAETTVRQVLQLSSAPVICSHTNLKTPAFDHPRFITADTARAVASAGGIVGAWPSGFGATTMADFVDRIFRLAEAVGPDHVALGTDMDGNYMPVLDNYRQIPLLVSELLRRGYGEAATEKFISGNFCRLWSQVVAA